MTELLPDDIDFESFGVATNGHREVGADPEDAGPPEDVPPEVLESFAVYEPTPPPARAECLLTGSDWPAAPGELAYSGLGGDVVRTIAPHSEADPVALLASFFAGFGNLVGRGPHVRVEAAEHPARLNVVVVGDSSRGRKGTAEGQTRRLLAMVDESYPARIESGLSSGEGLTNAVRDGDADDEEGVTDKRLLVIESEFAGALKVMQRQGNTLSVVLRNAWDGTTLSALTRNARLKATGAHISISGQITIEELRRLLDQTEAANGFGNRFLWFCVRRSKFLPEGGQVPQQELNALASRIARAAEHADRRLLQAARLVHSRSKALARASLEAPPTDPRLHGQPGSSRMELGLLAGRARDTCAR